MKIFITGATGMLGRVLIKKMSLNSGFNISAVSRKKQKNKIDDGVVNWLCFDLTNLKELASNISLLKPDLIIVSLGTNEGQDYKKTNDEFANQIDSFINSVSFLSTNKPYLNELS